MFKILNKKNITKNVYIIKIQAPRVSRAILPGQFVIVRVDDKGERTPFPVCEFDGEQGTVSIVFKAIGNTANDLINLNVGDNIKDFVGPIGHASHLVDKIKELKNVLFVADDLGFARIYTEIYWLNKNNISSDAIISFDTNDELEFKDKISVVCRNLTEAKSDTADICEKLAEKLNSNTKYDMVVAVGSTEMMRQVTKITKEKNVDTIVSLTTLILDGTGMCGACRLTIGNEVKFVCQDGPEFDANLVDYDEVERRQKFYSSYEEKEKFRLENGKENEAATGLEVE
ncbi:sulfide/dihydroorotate dehydrogenase-like FAD/NAD-binding protein [Clostridium akagii]|uniref:sulfide/dihydroorotate dehydrogenase-like FAD/NAD-binding protein n=1 Tax=Clostridium akagii TaxID=91623 RepID=UPI00047B6853|nr:sulfide/dihydroorotate dehydrogenase-like FAD/NAD-binding protein [Clostridium akagii]